jgi:hypothetical protein
LYPSALETEPARRALPLRLSLLLLLLTLTRLERHFSWLLEP